MINAATATASSSSLWDKLLNIFVSPGEVFDEVLAAPQTPVNWRVPTSFVCLAGIIQLQMAMTGDPAAAIQTFTGAATSQGEREMFSAAWPVVSSFAVCLTAFAGTLWAAFVLWFIGCMFLKVRFSYLKSFEVVGLTGMILVLGTVVTALLIAASGDPAARPSLSLLAGKLSTGHTRQVLDALNVFHVWGTLVLAIGLSKLSGVAFKEAAFWVFGYWLFARIAVIILA